MFLILLTAAPTGWAICSLPPPIDDPPPEDPPDDPTPEPPPPPETPRDDPPPESPPPTPPPETPTPRRPGPRTPGTPAPGTRRGPSYGASWRVWWELNREHWYGLRRTIASKDSVSGGSSETGDKLAAQYRDKVRQALRRVAERSTDTGVRAAAMRALGRAGNDDDARFLIGVLNRRQVPTAIHESAAIGLGLMPRIDDPEARKQLHAFFDRLLADKSWLPSNSRRLAILALSLHGRTDPVLAMKLADRCAKTKGSAREMPTLLYACGLTRDPRMQATVIAAVRGEKVRGKRLNDVARGRAALGLAASGDATAIPVLASVLTARSVRVHTRRSAAVGLGLLLRKPDLPAFKLEAAEKALRRAFRYDRDPLVKAYVAMSMGTAHKPMALAKLRDAVKDGDRIVRPYAAVALGLAAARTPEAESVRAFLVRELRRSKDLELTAALSIAVGISGADDAREHLFKCLRRKRLNVAVRAPAIQALGLLRKPSPEIEETLTEALDSKSHTVVEDASLALGFLGQRTTARMLVDKLRKTKSPSVQIHMVAALSHLGSTSAIDPLLRVLESRKAKATMRISAASALGILVDSREVDPLFEIDAHTNPYGLTSAGRTLVAVY